MGGPPKSFSTGLARMGLIKFRPFKVCMSPRILNCSPVKKAPRLPNFALLPCGTCLTGW